MKAIVCTAYGPPEVLQLKEVEKPAPKDNEVLIKICATTVTAGDVILRSMNAFQRVVFGLFFGLGKNKILGHELAGEIEAVGKDVAQFKPGDQVFASAGSGGGAYAQYICLRDDGMVATKPANAWRAFRRLALRANPIGDRGFLQPLRSNVASRGGTSFRRLLSTKPTRTIGGWLIHLCVEQTTFKGFVVGLVPIKVLLIRHQLVSFSM